MKPGCELMERALRRDVCADCFPGARLVGREAQSVGRRGAHVSRRLHELDWWGGDISGLIPGGSTACSDKKETENTHFCPRSPTRDKPRRSAGVRRVGLATGPITSRARARTGPEGGCQQQDRASAGPRRAGKTSSERGTLRVPTSCRARARARVGPCSSRAEAAVLRSRRGVPTSAP